MKFRLFLILKLFLMINIITFTYAHAQSSHKVALVVGNGDYNEDGDYLDRGDILAAKMDLSLTGNIFQDELSFDKVIVASNLNRAEFRNKVNEFREATRNADVAVFYFSGHGLVPPIGSKSKRQNYLVPVGVNFDDPNTIDNLERTTVSLSYIRSQVERPGLTSVDVPQLL